MTNRQGGRGTPSAHGVTGVILAGVALAWSLFQLWYASPLPFVFRFGVINDTEARAIHLGFAILLAFAICRARRDAVQERIPPHDWLLGIAAACSAAYLFLFHGALSARAGAPTGLDLTVGVVGIVLLLEATRRALGPPLTVVATVFLAYSFGGAYMPEVIAHKGASLTKVVSHQWLSTEGVFGVALGVSTSFVFLFVLFGALLEKAGAGRYFIRVAFAWLGHLRGGPAKAAVVSSGLSGLISGSSIANVVTTGTFTIPLMKRVGFPAAKAGAIEVAASTNGQLLPPIMGAAAFLMVEYVGIPYIEVIKHAFLPAVISYIALLYIVHLEAVKAGMRGLPRQEVSSWTARLFAVFTVVCALVILSAAVYYGLGWTKAAFGAGASWIAGFACLASYVGLARFSAGQTAHDDDTDMAHELEVAPPIGPTVRSGLDYLLPVVVLVWCLAVERLSPGLSAFWATALMAFIVLTRPALVALFQRGVGVAAAVRKGGEDLRDGLIAGARNMVGIGVATAAAGIVVGTVTLTGLGFVMTELVELISGGNVLLMLLFTALMSLILGMGLPTTANYIVVSTLMAPVIVTLGAAHGLVVPLIAVHLFVFYFGILADDTPPVGLAAFAAAGISGADPIRTGLQGFAYDIRTAVLPFMFVFNTELLLIGVTSLSALVMTIVSAVAAILAFAAATQGYWLDKSRIWETLALLLVAFTLFRPGFWWDKLYPPVVVVEPDSIAAYAETVPAGEGLRLRAEGEDLEGRWLEKTVVLPMGAVGAGEDRLQRAGLSLRNEGERVRVEGIVFGSAAERAGLDLDWVITGIETDAERPPKQLMFIPAALLAGLVAWRQRRRAALRPSVRSV